MKIKTVLVYDTQFTYVSKIKILKIRGKKNKKVWRTDIKINKTRPYLFHHIGKIKRLIKIFYLFSLDGII